MSNYKVSIIVPCYNIDSIDYVDINPFDEMISSIVNQSFGIENIEVILVDDCSTDNTRNLLTDLSLKYPSIKPIFMEKNSGRPSIPRNIGIDNSTTDYIMFLDQDDRMDLDCVKILYDTIINNPVDIVKSNYSILNGDEILKYDAGKCGELSIEPKSRDMIYLISHFVWGSIFNKEFINNNNIRFPDTQAEDILFLSKCYNLTDKPIISLNDYYGVIYTANNNNSVSHSFTLKQIEDYASIYEKCMDEYIDYKQSMEFILFNLERYITVIIGSLLRSEEDFNTKKKMIERVRTFILKYREYDVKLPLMWKIFYKLIIYNQKFIIIFSSTIINMIFENPLFTKLFRNKEYN